MTSNLGTAATRRRGSEPRGEEPARRPRPAPPAPGESGTPAATAASTAASRGVLSAHEHRAVWRAAVVETPPGGFSATGWRGRSCTHLCLAVRHPEEELGDTGSD